MNTLSRFRSLLILLAGAFFGLATVWASQIRQVWGRNLFITSDSMALLGVTLLISLLAVYLLPDFFVTRQTPRVIRHPPFVFRFFAIVFGLLSLVWLLYLVNQRIVHSFLSSADEHSCYFLAECLRKGKLYVDIPPLADFFKVVHVGMRDGKWFSVYPPGWPLIWAVGLQFNIVDWLNPVLSALSIFFFYKAGVRLFDRTAVILGLGVCVLSPFFMFTAASYFSHATCLFCISVFLYAFLRWHEGYAKEGDPVVWAALCGLATGYGLITRPLTMFAIAGTFLLYHFLPCFINTGCFFQKSGVKWGDRFRFALRRSDWVFVGIILFFISLGILQNYLVTGKPFKSPLKFYQSWERLGFKRGHYTPVDGFFFLISRVFYLMDWFAPGFVIVYLFLIFNIRRLKAILTPGVDRVKVLFRLVPVFLTFAYFLYYSWGGNQWGPRYWWEGMPFLCIPIADWIIVRWKSGRTRVRKFLLLFVVMSLVTSGMIFVRQAEYVEESSRQRRALYDLAEQTIQGPAIVFIHGHLGSRLIIAEEDAVRNSPFLDKRILYAHDLGDRNEELMVAYPGRRYYRGSYDGVLKQPKLESIYLKK